MKLLAFLLVVAVVAFTPKIGLTQTAAVADCDKTNAAKYLESIGAILSRDEPGRVVALQMPEGVGLNEQAWPSLSKLVDLRELDLGALGLPNRTLRHVRSLTQLRTLNLFGNQLDSIALVYIEGTQDLETLYLYRTFIDDDGIKSIAKLKKLKRLNMFDTFLTDKGLDRLGKCKQLRNLSIGNSKAGRFPESFFTSEGIQRLRKNLPNSEITYGGGSEKLDVPLMLQRIQQKRDTKAELEKAELEKAELELVKEVAAASPIAEREQGHDWPRFLGPDGNGKSGETGLVPDWNTQPPKLLWHKSIGTGFAAPSIKDGRHSWSPAA